MTKMFFECISSCNAVKERRGSMEKVALEAHSIRLEMAKCGRFIVLHTRSVLIGEVGDSLMKQTI